MQIKTSVYLRYLACRRNEVSLLDEENTYRDLIKRQNVFLPSSYMGIFLGAIMG
jgi:hypothetical protein